METMETLVNWEGFGGRDDDLKELGWLTLMETSLDEGLWLFLHKFAKACPSLAEKAANKTKTPIEDSNSVSRKIDQLSILVNGLGDQDSHLKGDLLALLDRSSALHNQRNAFVHGRVKWDRKKGALCFNSRRGSFKAERIRQLHEDYRDHLSSLYVEYFKLSFRLKGLRL